MFKRFAWPHVPRDFAALPVYATSANPESTPDGSVETPVSIISLEVVAL